MIIVLIRNKWLNKEQSNSVDLDKWNTHRGARPAGVAVLAKIGGINKLYLHYLSQMIIILITI